MKSFDVNLHNKRLQINGIFGGSALETGEQIPQKSETENAFAGKASFSPTPHAALCWLGKVYSARNQEEKKIKNVAKQADKQEASLPPFNLSLTKQGAFHASQGWTSHVSCFALTMIMLHLSAFVLFFMMLYADSKHDVVFGGVVHLAVICFTPLCISVTSMHRHKGLLLFLQLCGMYAVLTEGFYARLTSDSIYVFCASVVCCQVIWHVNKTGCKLALNVLYYSIHLLAIFAIIGLWTLRYMYETDREHIIKHAAQKYGFKDYHIVFDITTFATTIILFVCNKVFQAS